MASADELQLALDYPWEKWTVFLHPDQRDWVARDYGGPTRVSGSAGTGKTIVGIHRAAYLARTNPDASVLLTTATTCPWLSSTGAPLEPRAYSAVMATASTDRPPAGIFMYCEIPPEV
jgi:hypothetical protein